MPRLAVERLCCEYRSLTFDCIWFPGETLGTNEVETLLDEIGAVNTGRTVLDYGIFDPAATAEQKHTFLQRTIWCVIRHEGHPVGVVYNVALGELAGKPVIHLGLVKFSRRLGGDSIIAAYMPLCIGNLLNFGPFWATSISHVPFIIGCVSELAHDVYPGIQQQDEVLRVHYAEHLRLLRDEYIVPVLGCHPESVCERTFRIQGTLADVRHGFNLRAASLPRYDDESCNSFWENWLRTERDEQGEVCVVDDLIQIGEIDYRFLGKKMFYDRVNTLKLTSPLGSSRR